VHMLSLGVGMVAYDGSPLVHKSLIWDIIDMHGSEFSPLPWVATSLAYLPLSVTSVGVSPKYLQALQQASYAPKDHHSLASLKSMLTTGSPLQASLAV
jgi:acetoacetyl-CoA synthetase